MCSSMLFIDYCLFFLFYIHGMPANIELLDTNERRKTFAKSRKQGVDLLLGVGRT